MVVFERDIAVDMGTTTTLLFEEGKGIVAREPTVLAVDRVRGEIKKVGHNVFLCAPSNVNVSYTEEEKKVSAEMPWLKK